MGRGIAKSIRERFPEAYMTDVQTVSGDRSKLGKISVTKITTASQELYVVNAYTQYHYAAHSKLCLADYDAIQSCFKEIKQGFKQYRIGYPLIGAGLAGGDWKIISKIIDKELEGCDHTLVKLKV